MESPNKGKIIVEVTRAKLKIFFNVLDNIRKEKIVDENEKFDLEIDLLSRFFNIVFQIPSPLKISQVCSIKRVEEEDKSTLCDNRPQNDSLSSKDDDVESLPDELLEAEGAMCDEEEEVIDDFDDDIVEVETLGPERKTKDISTEKETPIQSSPDYSDTDLNCKTCGFVAGRNHSLKLHIV